MIRSSFIKAGFLLLMLVAAMGIGGAACVALLTGGPVEEGPTTGTIKGKVTDKSTGASIQGAEITTEPPTKEVATNSQGDYTISEIAPDDYTVKASGDGYNAGTKRVSVEAGKEATANIELDPTVVSVSVDPPSASINVGESTTFTAEVTYGNGSTDGDVSWSSSDESIAIASSNGVVTGKAVGVTTVTATSDKDTTKSGDATVNVVAPTSTPTPTLSPSPTSTPTPSPSPTPSPTTSPSPTPSSTPGPVSATNSTVTASPTSVVANGVSTSTVTVTLKDASGNLIGGHSVTILSATHATTIAPSSATTNTSGQATFTVKSTQGGTATITATDTTANVAISTTASISFTVDIVWVTKTPMPTARRELAAGVANVGGINKIYAIGGSSSASSYLTTVDEYDPVATSGWVTKAPMPTGRTQLAVGVVSNKIYAIGGYQGGSNYLTTVEEYNPTTNSWTPKASMPTARSLLAVGVVNNKIYAIGGANNATTFATMEEYNPSTNTWATKAPMPTGRTQLAVGVVNVGGSDKIYAIGGLANGINLTTVEEYDPGTNTWTTKVPMPTGRRALAVGVVGGKIYAIGGSGDVCVHCATVEEYDPATNTWTTKTPMPTGRYGLAVGVVGSKIYVVGGTSSASSYLTTVEEGTLAP